MINGVLTGFLLVIVVGIISKCSGGSSNKQDIYVPKVSVQSTTTNYKIAKDTFELNLENKDPFNASIAFKKAEGNTPVKSKAVKTQPDKELVWPRIEYYGFVKGKQNVDKMVLIKVNKALLRKREHESIADLKIVKAYSDSIIVSLNQNHKTIKRKK